VFKFNMGDSDRWIKWTGTRVNVGGDIIATGNIEGGAVSGFVAENDSTYTGDGIIGLSNIEVQSEFNGVLLIGMVAIGLPAVTGSTGYTAYIPIVYYDEANPAMSETRSYAVHYSSDLWSMGQLSLWRTAPSNVLLWSTYVRVLDPVYMIYYNGYPQPGATLSAMVSKR
jgi:hypothetical protein